MTDFQWAVGKAGPVSSESGTGKDQVVGLALTAFGFLEGSTSVARRRADTSVQTTFGYVLGETFVEVELDWREQAVFVLVGWCRDGEVPDGYYVDSRGTVVRHQLGAVLERGQSADRAAAARLHEALRSSGPKAMARQIDAYSDVLRAAHARLPELLSNLHNTGL